MIIALLESRSGAMLGGEDAIQSPLRAVARDDFDLTVPGGLAESVTGRRENQG